MSRKDREMQQYRNDGMAYAYKIAKEKGIEALEKEIKYRKATFLPSAVQEKDVTKFVDETKENCLDTVLIMAMMVLRDEFDFGEVRLNRFKERFNSKADVLVANNATWKDLQEILKEETNIDTKIRKDIRQIGRISEKTFSSGQITNVNFVELRIILSAKMAQKLS